MSRYVPTAAQKAKSDERKAKMRALAKQISAMSDDARAELASRCPVVTIEGKCLSVHNQCMISVSAPLALFAA